MDKIKILILPAGSSDMNEAVKLTIKGKTQQEELDNLIHLMTVLWQTTDGEIAAKYN